MSRITVQRLIRLCIFFLALTKMTLATPTNNISQRKYKPQHLPPQLEYGEVATRPANSDLSLRQPAAISIRSTLSKRINLWDNLRLGTLYIVWSATRLNSLTNPSPSPPDPYLASLKRLYTSIRRDALSTWTSLPERSYVRIVYGSIVFTLLPPADRTVPWSILEEVAYSLLLLVSGGLGGLVTGTYVQIATSVAFYYYLQVIMPVPEGQGGGTEQSPGGMPMGGGAAPVVYSRFGN